MSLPKIERVESDRKTRHKMNCYYETMDEEHLPLIMGYKRTKARNRRFYINMSYKHLCEAYLETMNDCKYEMSDFIKKPSQNTLPHSSFLQ